MELNSHFEKPYDAKPSKHYHSAIKNNIYKYFMGCKDAVCDCTTPLNNVLNHSKIFFCNKHASIYYSRYFSTNSNIYHCIRCAKYINKETEFFMHVEINYPTCLKQYCICNDCSDLCFTD